MNAAQEQLHERVDRYLHEAFGELVKNAPNEPAFFVPLGRIGVRVEVEEIDDHNAIVECYAWIAQQLTADERLAAWLARRNAGMRFAALCVDDEGAVIVRHALFADGLEKPVLARLVEVMASTADELDEELRDSFA